MNFASGDSGEQILRSWTKSFRLFLKSKPLSLMSLKAIDIAEPRCLNILHHSRYILPNYIISVYSDSHVSQLCFISCFISSTLNSCPGANILASSDDKLDSI
jgi:hypothetical protein